MVECCGYNYNGLQLAFFILSTTYCLQLRYYELHPSIMKTWLGLNFFTVLSKIDQIQWNICSISLLAKLNIYVLVLQLNQMLSAINFTRLVFNQTKFSPRRDFYKRNCNLSKITALVTL